jgi:hypothetical protein
LIVAAGLTTSPARAGNDNPVMLQWFEARWQDMERRVPDFFLAGYGSVWATAAEQGGSFGQPGV